MSRSKGGPRSSAAHGTRGSRDQPRQLAPRGERSGPRLAAEPSRRAVVVGTIVSIALIIGTGAACYSNALHAPFAFDDEIAVVTNPAIKQATGDGGLASIWRWNPRRFIPHVTLALNYRSGGLATFGYHVVNVAIHIGAALALFWWLILLQRTPASLSSPFSRADGALVLGGFMIPGRLLLAAFGALLFVAHPIQTQAVTYVVQRAASLAAFFYLVALALYTQGALLRAAGTATRSPRLLCFAASGLMFGLALLCKENAVTWPAAVLLVEWLLFQPSRARLIRQAIGLVAVMSALLVVAIGALLRRGMALADLGGLLSTGAHTPPRWQYMLTQLNVLRTYVRLLFLPVAQNLDYDYPLASSLFESQTLLSLAFLLSLVCLAVWLRRRSPLGALGIAFFLVTLTVESTVIPFPDVIFEHRLYLPFVGFVVAILAAAMALLRRFSAPGGRPGPGAIGVCSGAFLVILLAAGTATFRRNAVWANGLTLWTDVVQKSPGKARPYHNLARELAAVGRYQEAAAAYRHALALDPGLAPAYNNLGNVYQRLGQRPEAEAAYRQALALDPGYSDASHNLGFLYIEMGRLNEAEMRLGMAAALQPLDGELQRGLAKLYLKRGNVPEAEQRFRRAITLDPENADAHNDYGSLCYQQGRLDEAEQEFRRATELNPRFAFAYNNLGNVLVIKQAFAAAEAAYQRALQITPDDAETWLNLGHAYKMMRRWREAETAYRAVLQRKADFAEALFGLATVYHELGMEPEAQTALQRARAVATPQS